MRKMKKNSVKVLAAVIVLAIALGIFPGSVAAYATEDDYSEMSPIQLYMLAGKYEKGKEGYPVDHEKALELYTLCAETGVYYGMAKLGEVLLYGDLGVQDLDKAFEMLSKAALHGDQNSRYYLNIVAMNYYFGINGWPLAPAWALPWFEAAGEAGDASSMYYAGCIYLDGAPGMEANAEKAIYWLEKAIDRGDKSAAMELAYAYYYGKSPFHQDLKQAANYFLTAAESGNTDAMMMLGDMYESGYGITKNKEEYIRWYTLAAEGGEEFAIARLGSEYSFGGNVKQDDAEAYKWYEKGAELENASCMYELGKMYFDGVYVDQDIEMAVEWMTKAGEGKDVFAMAELHRIYRDGVGVAQDTEKAEYWAKKLKKTDPDMAYMLESTERYY